MGGWIRIRGLDSCHQDLGRAPVPSLSLETPRPIGLLLQNQQEAVVGERGVGRANTPLSASSSRPLSASV